MLLHSKSSYLNLLLFLPLFTIIIEVVKADCETSIETLYSAHLFGPCSVSNLTIEQLRTDPCPEACQEVYNAVMGNCTVGVSRYEGGFLTYQESTLFHHEGRKWASCHYGYTPTNCDQALMNLDEARTSELYWAHLGPRSVPPVCAAGTPATNNLPCSSECIDYIDALVKACDADENAEFAPDGGYLDRTQIRIPWEFPTALEWLGFSPDIFGPGLVTLSKTCWDYYEGSAMTARQQDNMMPETSSSSCAFIYTGLGSALVAASLLLP